MSKRAYRIKSLFGYRVRVYKIRSHPPARTHALTYYTPHSPQLFSNSVLPVHSLLALLSSRCASFSISRNRSIYASITAYPMKDNIQKIVIYFYLNVAMLFYYGIMHSCKRCTTTVHYKHIKVPNEMAKIVSPEVSARASSIA